MKVVILCGGLGMRLQQETEFRPKPLVEIGGRPILWHIMKMYAYCGFREFILCLGYRGNMIKDYFLNYEAINNNFTIHLGKNHRLDYHDEHEEQDFRITLADTGLDVQTGSRVARVRRYLGDDDAFMVSYGDGVADLDVRGLLEFHNAHGRIATVTTVRPVTRWGVIESEPSGRVARFSEKPQVEGWVSIGHFVFDRRIFDYLREDPDLVLEGEPMERLVQDGQLMAYRHEGFYHAMDTYREFKLLNDMWDAGNAPWRTWGRPDASGPPSHGLAAGGRMSQASRALGPDRGD